MKVDILTQLLFSLTGLTVEDLVAEAAAETPEEAEEIHINNLCRMFDYQDGI